MIESQILFCMIDSLTMNIMKTYSLFQLYLLFISKKTQEQKVPSSHLIIISVLGVGWLRVIMQYLSLKHKGLSIANNHGHHKVSVKLSAC